jgi:hypothetical protein
MNHKLFLKATCLIIITSLSLRCNDAKKQLSFSYYEGLKIDTSNIHFENTSFSIINSKNEISSFSELNIGKRIKLNNSLDFTDDFKYVFSYGKRIKSIFIDEEIYKDCPYLKDYGHLPINVEYNLQFSDTVFIYQIDSEDKLSGPCG